MKNFDTWNVLKKELETKVANTLFREGEIWWCSFGENLGKEICGKNIYFERPTLVLKKFDSDTALVLPITSTIKEGTFYCNLFLNGKERNILLHQSRFISSKRLLRKIEKISVNKLNLVKEKFNELYKIEKSGFPDFSPVPDGKDTINIANTEFLSSYKEAPCIVKNLIELHVDDFEKVKEFYKNFEFKIIWERRPEKFKGYLLLQTENNLLCFWGGNAEIYKHEYFEKFYKHENMKKGVGVEIVIMYESLEKLQNMYKIAKKLNCVVEDLKLEAWNLYDFRITDPSGYYLRFTTDHNILDNKYAVK